MVTLYTDERMLDHHPPSRHPESPDRLKAILRHLDRTGLRARLEDGLVREATRSELLRVHDAAYLDRLSTFEIKGGGLYEADTWVYPGSSQAGLIAAGSCVEAVNQVGTGALKDRRAVCLVRPPATTPVRPTRWGFACMRASPLLPQTPYSGSACRGS